MAWSAGLPTMFIWANPYAHDVLKSRIQTNRIKPLVWENPSVHRTFLVCPFEPLRSVVSLSETLIHDGDVLRWNVPSLRHLLHLLEVRHLGNESVAAAGYRDNSYKPPGYGEDRIKLLAIRHTRFKLGDQRIAARLHLVLGNKQLFPVFTLTAMGMEVWQTHRHLPFQSCPAKSKRKRPLSPC